MEHPLFDLDGDELPDLIDAELKGDTVDVKQESTPVAADKLKIE